MPDAFSRLLNAWPRRRGARDNREVFTQAFQSFAQLALLKDPVLRTLASASAINMFGRSAFITLTVLFATTRVGIPATSTAVILTVANAVGLVTATASGHLADRIPARTMMPVSMAIEGLALCAVPWCTTAVALGLVAALFVGANRATWAVRAATVAYAFTSGERAAPRAILKMGNNASVALGSTAAAIPVILNATVAYQVAFAIAGCAALASAVIIRRLPLIRSGRRAEHRRTSPVEERSPFRDLRYLGVTVLAGLFAMQFAVAEVGLPIWITTETTAPKVLVTLAFAINTVLIVVLQLPLSRGTDRVSRAANVSAVAGILMLGACALYASSAWPAAPLATLLLMAAVIAQTLAEILSSAGSAGLSFELAAPTRAGAYQGVFAMGMSLGSMLAPLVVVAVIGYGPAGWIALGAVFLLAGAGMRMLARERLDPQLVADRASEPG